MGFFDDMDKRITAEAKQKIADGKDTGHTALMDDLHALLQQAKAFEFHDFLNEKHAMPKGVLADILTKMRDKVIAGIYDN